MFLMFLLVATSQAASLHQDLVEKGYEIPGYAFGLDYDYTGYDPQPAQYTPDPLEKAIGGIEDQLMGIVKQSMAFAGGFEDLLNSFLMEYTKAVLPVIESIPANVLKDFVVGVAKAVSIFLKGLGPIIKNYNPLHPQNPAEIRSVIRRELTTISTFGKAVANLFDVVDDVVLAYVDMAINALNQQAAGLTSAIEQLEEIPPEYLKEMTVTMLKQVVQAFEYQLEAP